MLTPTQMNNKRKYILYALLFSAVILFSTSAYLAIKNFSKKAPLQDKVTQDINRRNNTKGKGNEHNQSQENHNKETFFIFLRKITHSQEEKKQNSKNSQSNSKSQQTCNSNQEYLANDLDEITVHCGDIIILTLTYKPSTGYTPFSPEYDPKVFKLISVNDKDISSPKSKEPGYTGGDSILRTYKFKTLRETSGETIDIGIFKECEPEKTKMIVQKIKVAVNNRATKFSCDSDNEYDITNLKDVTIHCGDIVKISTTYNGTTGYTPFPPEYNKTIFKLLNYIDVTKTRKTTGDSQTTRIYRFKSIGQTNKTTIKLGIYHSWDPDDSKIIKKSINITIK